MLNSLLEQFLVSEIFAFLLIFSRVGAGVMLLPAIGEAYVSPRIRLIFALMMSLVLVPVFSNIMPPVPASPLSLTVLLVAEIMVGVFLGFLSRLLVSVMHMAGTIIAYQSSLAMATMFDISQGGQSTVVSNFLTISAILVFFTFDIHHLMLSGLADSYSLFPPGQFPIVGDMAEHYMMLFDKAFTIAIQLSAPHLVFALLFYLGSGVLGRLMPTMQVFFILMPIQIMIAFFLLLAIFNTLLLSYTDFVEESLNSFMEQY